MRSKQACGYLKDGIRGDTARNERQMFMIFHALRDPHNQLTNGAREKENGFYFEHTINVYTNYYGGFSTPPQSPCLRQCKPIPFSFNVSIKI